MIDYKIPLDVIEKFLQGHDTEEYIVNLEYDKETNLIHKIKHLPDGTKLNEAEPLKAFLWMKHLGELVEKYNFYKSNQLTIRTAMEEYGIEVKKLDHHNNDRLVKGYTHLLTCDQGHERMLDFFRKGGFWKGIQFDPEIKDNFLILSPVEQFLIGTGKRLFKGYEDYDDIEKYVFDLETTGLDPNVSRIFLIGCKTNKGFEVLFDCETEGENADKTEIAAIAKFFATIDYLKPAIIGGYNSANFDWGFVFRRCEILGVQITDFAKTLKEGVDIFRKEGSLKLGNEVEKYEQIYMYGYSVIDIIHSARRAQAIDSDMKFTNLKYVCKYNKVAKKNRVYVPGGKIGAYWHTGDRFYFDDRTGNYSKTKPTIEKMNFVSRETIRENKNKIFIFGDNDLKSGYGGQAKEMRDEPNTIGIPTKKKPDNSDDSFYTDAEFEENKKKINFAINLILKELKNGKTIVIPSNGIGTGLARLEQKAPKTFTFLQKSLSAVEQYANSFIECDGKYIVKRYLMDDLWETLEVDNIYNQTSFMLAKMVPTTYQRVSTMGTAGLWKMLMLTWSFEHNLAIPIADVKRDFVGGLSRLLSVGYSKKLRKMDYNSLYPAIQLAHLIFPEVDVSGALRSMLKYFHSERFKAKDLAKMHDKAGNKQMASKFKRKQLPLKIFINSMYGALTAPNAFPWAEMDKGEQVTCTARQYLRLMVKFFGKKGYKPTVLDTDGVNFTAGDIDEEQFVYIGKGLNSEVEAGKEYRGVMAVVQEFNDLYMRGEMALGLDGTWPATANFSRKNYVLLEDDGKIKLTGNTIKSKKMPGYIEEFLDNAFVLLLNGKGYDFMQYYYSYVERIIDRKIPLSKIATKARVKKSVEQYKNRGVNKKGQLKPKQAHMELAIKHNMPISLGDTIYYVNVGSKKSHGDVTIDKATGELLIKLLGDDVMEKAPDTLGEYNIDKYLAMFNKRVEVLLIVFEKSIRYITTEKMVKNKKTNEVSVKISKKQNMLISNLDEKKSWMLNELELVSGQPNDESDQDTLEELFTPSDKEMELWQKLGYKADFWFQDEIEFTVPGLEMTIPV